MKRILLSFSVILLFIFYSLQQRNESDQAAVISPKQNVETSGISPPSTAPQTSGQYKDGQYTGDAVDVFYGNVQVKAIIQNGKITDVQFLQSPNDRQTSIMINSQAMPLLTQEAIQAQSANVDIISGATDSSKGFIQSLGSALNQAK